MRVLITVATSLVALGISGASAEQIRSCELTVDGRAFIDGPCDFDGIGAGDFIITRGDYFAYVFVSYDPPTGSWNGRGGSTHAHDPLGELVRDGACWVNDNARVCASR
jgi:hypothetical protein